MDIKELNTLLNGFSEELGKEVITEDKVVELVKAMNEAEESEFVAPFFAGFYESLYCEDCTPDDLFNDYYRVPDPIVDWAMEHAEDTDWEGYKKEVCETYIGYVEQEIKSVIPNFHASFKELDSPKAYNYTTDMCIGVCNFEDVKEDIAKYIEEHKEKFAEIVKRRFTSRDGFISFYDNDINSPDWSLDRADLDHNEIGTILSVILECEMDNVQDLNYWTWEDTHEGYTFDFEEMKKNFNFDVEPEEEEDLYYYVYDEETDTYKWNKDAPGQMKLFDMEKEV